MNRSWPLILRVVILAIALGAASGVVGAALTTIYLSNYADALGGTTAPSFSFSGARPAPATASTLSDMRDVVFGASVQLYKAKTESPDPSKADRQGVVLTSDGWLAVADADSGLATAVIGRRSYPITRSVTDPASGVVFLKVDARDLPTIGFGDAFSLAAGDDEYAVDGRESLRRVRVLSVSQPLQAISDKVARRIVLDVPASSAFAPAFSSTGDLIGFVSVDGSLLSVNAFLPAFQSLLKDGTISRPTLGISFINLASSIVPATNTIDAPDTGEQVISVAKGSVAQTAGLQAGDVMVSLDDRPLDNDAPLDEQLLQEDVGDTPVLSIMRGTNTLTLPLPLR